ncbi:Crp/Fnr family transcriptional regulator [Synechococcus sp. Nb3U1]|nr:Crp/Fnr family transcriptional regulator [Synechococcus sp. Nb3U1]
MPLTGGILWQIETGVLRTITCGIEGELLTLGVWGNGDVVGWEQNLLQEVGAECLSWVEARLLPVEQLQCSCQQEPSWIQEATLQHIQRCQEMIRILQCRKLYPKLLHLLVWIAQRFGTSEGESYRLNPALTRQDLSEIIGTTRVTVTRFFHLYEQAKLLRRLKDRSLAIYAEKIKKIGLDY